MRLGIILPALQLEWHAAIIASLSKRGYEPILFKPDDCDPALSRREGRESGPRWLRDLIIRGTPALKPAAIQQETTFLKGPPELKDVSIRPDLLLVLDGSRSPSAIARRADCEVWSFWGTSDPVQCAVDTVFESIVSGDSTVAIELVRTRPDGCSQILRTGRSQTYPAAPSRTLETLLGALAIWLPAPGAAGSHAEETPPRESNAAKPALNVSRLLWLLCWGWARRRFRDLGRRDIWNVGIIDHPIAKVAFGGHDLPVRWLPRPKADAFRADPFGILLDGEWWIAYERYDQSLRSGHIRLVRPTTGEEIAPPIGEGEYHHSFPYIFRYGNSQYCIPESSRTAETWIWRVSDSGEWERAAPLLHGLPLVDATVFEWQGRWWLFAALQNERPLQTLFAWHSGSPFGPWEAHLMNPIKTDPESSRPAGAPFVYEGELYRPAQDGRRTYGGGVAISQVTMLTPHNFREVDAGALLPQDQEYPHGLHTLNSLGDTHTLIDGKRTVLSASQLLANVTAHFTRASISRLRSEVGENDDPSGAFKSRQKPLSRLTSVSKRWIGPAFNFLGRISGVIVTLIIVRLVGADGETTPLFLAMALSTFASNTLGATLELQGIANLARRGDGVARSIAFGALLIGMAMSLLVAVVLFFLAMVNETFSHVQDYFLFFIPTIPLTCLFYAYLGIAVHKGNWLSPAWGSGLRTIVIGISLSAVLPGMDLHFVPAILLLGELLRVVFVLKALPLTGRIDRHDCIHFLRQVLIQTPSSLLGSANTAIDRYVTGLLGLGSVAILDLAEKAHGVVSLSYSQGILPFLYRDWSMETNLASLRSRVLRASGMTLFAGSLLAIAGSSAIWQFSGPVLGAAASPQAETVRLTSVMFFVGMPAYLAGQALVRLLILRGQVAWFNVTAAIQLALNVSLDLALGPRFGLPGIAAASSAVMWIGFFMFLGLSVLRSPKGRF